MSPKESDVARARSRITTICENARKMLLEGTKASDPHRVENAWVEGKIWRKVYEPYESELKKLLKTNNLEVILCDGITTPHLIKRWIRVQADEKYVIKHRE